MYKKYILCLVLCVLWIFFSSLSVYADTDADDYFARITANSGTISLAHQAAITDFVTAAKAHGYWSKLIDIGPLA